MDSSYTYKLLIMYDGTPFSGWQVQPNATSVQQKIQEAILAITKEHVHVIGSGRTDTGVHALGQAAHFKIDKELNLYRFQHSLNALLPAEICVKEVSLVPSDFHARYSAKRKTYRYHICLARPQSPFIRLYSWQMKEVIDLSLLKAAACQLIGTHDFTSFANKAHSGCASRDPTRTLYRLDVIEQPEALILELEANGFLNKMVRNIVGTLIDIATLRIASNAIPEILAAKDRCRAGSTAPPHGLFLLKVDY